MADHPFNPLPLGVPIAGPPAAPTVQVSTTADRPSQRQQIQEVLDQAAAGGQGSLVRIRIPFSLYDQARRRSYIQLRDAIWTISLPVETTTPETIEEFIDVLGRCIVEIAQQGSQRVLQKLQTPLAQDGVAVGEVEVGEQP